MPCPDLGVACFDNVTVSPLMVQEGAPLHRRFAAHDAEGRFVDAMRLRRSYAASGDLPPVTEAEHVPGETVYAGYLDPHFGHFLVESLSRAWYLRDNPGARLCWHVRTRRRLPAWQLDLFAMFGLDPARFLIIDRNYRFERLIVPDPGAVIDRFYHPRQVVAMQTWPFATPVPGRRIWLSRSRYGATLGRVQREEEVEAVLRDRGWHIFHPEDHSIAEQLAAIGDAETLAGIEGSAFHIVLLGRAVRTRLLILPRGAQLLPAYDLIAKAKGLDQHAVQVPMTHLAGRHRRSEYRIDDPAAAALLIDAAAGC